MVEQIPFQTIFQFLQTVGILVGVFYYIITIRTNQRNQELTLRAQELTLKAQEQALETRQTQIFMQIYNQSHNDPSFLKAIGRIFDIVSTTPVTSYEEFQKLRENEQDRDAISRVSFFYEGVGVLVKEGYVSIRLVALLMTGMTKFWWEGLYKFSIVEGRKLMNSPRWNSEAEYLYDELMKYIEEHPELKN